MKRFFLFFLLPREFNLEQVFFRAVIAGIINIPEGICENERFDQFHQENSSNEAFKSKEHMGDQTVLGDEECQDCFVKPEFIALYGDKVFPDRKSLRQILKTENDQGSVKLLTKQYYRINIWIKTNIVMRVKLREFIYMLLT